MIFQCSKVIRSHSLCGICIKWSNSCAWMPFEIFFRYTHAVDFFLDILKKTCLIFCNQDCVWLCFNAFMCRNLCWCRDYHVDMSHICMAPEPCLNIKDVFPSYGDFPVKDKTVARPSYLWHGDTHTGKTTYLYWDGHQNLKSKWMKPKTKTAITVKMTF